MENTQLLIEKKAMLRQKMLSIRDAIPKNLRSQKSSIIADQILQIVEAEKFSTIMTYVSARSEVETHYIIDQLIDTDKVVLAPLVKKGQKDLMVYRILDWKLDLIKGHFGILEPIPERCQRFDESEIGLVLVPGLAFNRLGYRIGYGAGYYDRFLKKCPQAVSVGLAYKEQIVDDLFQIYWDVPVNRIVVEEEVLT